MPCPIGTLPIVDPDHWSAGSTIPWLSPGESIPVRRPKPKRPIHDIRRFLPSSSANVIAPTFDERARIWATDIVSVPRGSASWIVLSATRMEYGSVNFLHGVTIPVESAPPTVTSLNVDPGS